jgi:hypothetical protein
LGQGGSKYPFGSDQLLKITALRADRRPRFHCKRVKRHLAVYGSLDASWHQSQDAQALQVRLKDVW